MKFLKNSIKLIALALLFTVGACNDKYPDLGDGLFAEMVTSKGTIVIKLTPEKTPVTVANFVALAEGTHPMVTDSMKGKPFYNGLTFHRVMDKFMIQGGDPLASGTGGPGYKFGDEFDDTLKHDRPGIISMANGGPDANGSQFFLTEVPTPWLDNRHSVFGEIVLGLDVQDSISNVAVAPGNNKPVDIVYINEVNIIRQGYDARNFDAVKVWESELPLLAEKKKQRQEEARLAAEQAQKEAAEKTALVAAELLPVLEEYKGKSTASSTGLLKHVINKGNGTKVKQGDNVTVWYEGYFADGVLFDSNKKDIEEKFGRLNPQKEQRGMYNPMPMEISPDAQIVAGFKEAAASMEVGEKSYFYLPSHLAYGEAGRGQIQPNTDLIFILELVEITK